MSMDYIAIYIYSTLYVEEDAPEDIELTLYAGTDPDDAMAEIMEVAEEHGFEENLGWDIDTGDNEINYKLNELDLGEALKFVEMNDFSDIDIALAIWDNSNSPIENTVECMNRGNYTIWSGKEEFVDDRLAIHRLPAEVENLIDTDEAYDHYSDGLTILEMDDGRLIEVL